MALFTKKPTGRSPRPRSRKPNINTYYRAEQKPADSPFVQKPPKKNVRKFLFGFADVIILAILILALVYSLAVRSNPKVEANNFSYHTQTEYAAAARTQFSSFKNRNKITFDETGIVQSLQKQFPEISAVQVELPIFSEQPVLHLTVSMPSFTLNSQQTSLIVDSDGVAVAPTSAINIRGLPAIIDSSGYPAKAGSQVLSADSVDFVNTLIAQCRRAKVPITSLTLPAEPQELQLRTKDAGYFVKFYLGGDAMQETGQFLAARQHFEKNHQPPAQYLDVRVSGKIFYK